MTRRTPTKPPDDKLMWKRALKPHHPDLGGTAEDFVWLNHVKELVCSGRMGEQSARPRAGEATTANSPPDPDRIPWSGAYDFEEVTHTALRYAALGEPYSLLLSLLADCRPLDNMVRQQSRGASYRQLAAVGHAWGMTKRERVAWYRVAEDLALTDRHASHLLGRLKRRAA